MVKNIFAYEGSREQVEELFNLVDKLTSLYTIHHSGTLLARQGENCTRIEPVSLSTGRAGIGSISFTGNQGDLERAATLLKIEYSDPVTLTMELNMNDQKYLISTPWYHGSGTLFIGRNPFLSLDINETGGQYPVKQFLVEAYGDLEAATFPHDVHMKFRGEEFFSCK